MLSAINYRPASVRKRKRASALASLSAVRPASVVLSLWAGNSPAIIQRHYRGLIKNKGNIRAFWQIGPDGWKPANKNNKRNKKREKAEATSIPPTDAAPHPIPPEGYGERIR